MVFGLPLLSNNIDDFTNKLKELKYKISSIQFVLFKRNNNFLFMSYSKFIEQKLLNYPSKRNENIERPIEKNYVKNDFKREIIFKIKPDIQNDIYLFIWIK